VLSLLATPFLHPTCDFPGPYRWGDNGLALSLVEDQVVLRPQAIDGLGLLAHFSVHVDQRDAAAEGRQVLNERQQKKKVQHVPCGASGTPVTALFHPA
jgi:hypothetical protein